MSYGSISVLQADEEGNFEHVDTTHQRSSSSGDSSSLGSSVGSVASATRELIVSSLRFGGRQCSIRDLGANASIHSEVINITKNLIGAGVLSLSSGIARYANNPWAVCSAWVWIFIQGFIFGYFCLLIAKVCQITHSSTFRSCWEQTMGEKGSLAVAFVTAVKPAMGNLAYSTILSQTLSSLCASIHVTITPTKSLLLITFFVLLPLCLLKNLHVLAPFSVLGTTGVLITAVSMVIRWVDGSYHPTGRYFKDLPGNLQPHFGHRNEYASLQTLPLVCMLFEAYVMHYNSPRYYAELKDASIARFAVAVSASFGFTALLYAVIASVGFLTFGENANSFILNNYSPYDPLATVCRIAISLSVLTTYPIAFIGFRDGVLDMMEIPSEKQTSWNLNVLTLALLVVITITAMFVTDLGMINAVGGGILATVLCFIFPALMYRRAILILSIPVPSQGRQSLEVGIVVGLTGLGTLLGVVGVWEAVYQQRANK